VVLKETAGRTWQAQAQAQGFLKIGFAEIAAGSLELTVAVAGRWPLAQHIRLVDEYILLGYPSTVSFKSIHLSGELYGGPYIWWMVGTVDPRVLPVCHPHLLPIQSPRTHPVGVLTGNHIQFGRRRYNPQHASHVIVTFGTLCLTARFGGGPAEKSSSLSRQMSR